MADDNQIERERKEKLARAKEHLKKAQQKKKQHKSSESRDVSSLFSTPTEESDAPFIPESSPQIPQDDTIDVSANHNEEKEAEKVVKAVDNDTEDVSTELRSQISQLESTISTQTSELDSLKEQLNQANDDHEASLLEKKNTIDALEKTIIELNTSSNNNDHISLLERKLDSIQAEFMSNKSELDSSHSKLSELQENFQQKEAELVSLNDKLSQTSESLLKSKLDNKKVRDELDSSSKQVDTLNQQVHDAVSEKTSLQSTIDQLNDQLKSFEVVQTDRNQLSSMNESLREQLASVEAQNASLRREMQDKEDGKNLDQEASTLPLNTNGHFVSAAARSLIPSSVMHKRRESLQMLKIRMNSHTKSPEMNTLGEETQDSLARHPRNQFMTNDDPLFFCAACENDNDEGQGLIVL